MTAEPGNDAATLADIMKFAVTVSRPHRRGRGREKLHTFLLLSNGNWWPQQISTLKQNAAWRQAVKVRREMIARGGNPRPPPAPERRLRNFPLRRHPGPIVHLADGVDIQESALAVVLDALHRAGQHNVSLHFIKVVVSELGSTLNRFVRMDLDAKQNAVETLHLEILERCSRLVEST